jgi:hypothetical protein
MLILLKISPYISPEKFYFFNQQKQAHEKNCITATSAAVALLNSLYSNNGYKRAG